METSPSITAPDDRADRAGLGEIGDWPAVRRDLIPEQWGDAEYEGRSHATEIQHHLFAERLRGVEELEPVHEIGEGGLLGRCGCRRR